MAPVREIIYKVLGAFQMVLLKYIAQWFTNNMG